MGLMSPLISCSICYVHFTRLVLYDKLCACTVVDLVYEYPVIFIEIIQGQWPSLKHTYLMIHYCFQSVQVKIELGHKATVRKKQTADGFTHDWKVFVRGPEGSNIQNFVEKVVFHLHDSFPKPKRGKTDNKRNVYSLCFYVR